jgi:hypothetical protein
VLDPHCVEGEVEGLRSSHALLTKRAGSSHMAAYEIWARGPLARPKRGAAPAPTEGDEDQDEAGAP